MSVLQRVALYPNERLDTPDARAIEAFAQNDWRFFLSGVMSSKSYILSGFEITNYTNIFIVPGIRLRQNNVVVMHPEATTQAAGFYVAAGSEADAQLQLSPNTTNFVELDFGTSSGTPDTRAFWDMGADGGKGAEFTDNVDTVINLELVISSNVSNFTPGKIPLYKIVTNASGIAVSCTDCRNLFFRLGTGGSNPNPNSSYVWDANSPDASHSQLETPGTALSATTSNAPFQGGDKNIKSMKNWMDSVMSLLMANKATPYWYMKSQSIPETYQNSSMMLYVGGVWKHETTLGRLTLQGGSTLYRLGKNNNVSLSPFASLDLTANNTLFIILPSDAAVNYGMGQDASHPVVPKLVTSFTANQIVIAGNGNYILTGGKLMIKGQTVSYQSAVYDNIADKTTFLVVTPDPQSIVSVGDTVYQLDNSTVGYYHYGQPASVPGMQNGISEGVEKTTWMCFFDGTKMHTPTSELVQGEQIQVGGTTAQAILTYIGSTGEADSTPVYNVGSIANGTNLTSAIKTAFNIIEKPIYDEIVIDVGGTGWPNGTIVTLPPNSRAGNVPGQYTIGTGELLVFENGALWRAGYDYTELSNNTIQSLRDVPVGSYFRFRNAQIGGAGAAAGGGNTGTTLQIAYANGRSVTTTPGNPLEIFGTAGEKLLKIHGDVQIDGVLDPTGIQLTPVASNPLASGQMGLWVDTTAGHLNYTRADASVLPVGQLLETAAGGAANFTRTFTNASLATIPQGAPVYIVSPGNIALAHADSDTAHMVVGFTATSIAAGASGKVIYAGVVPGIFTGLGYNSGYIWLSETPGALYLVAASTPGSYEVSLGLIDGNDLIIQIQRHGQV